MVAQLDYTIVESIGQQYLPQLVLDAYAIGWHIIPVGLDKKPYFSWKQYQKTRPTLEQLIQWQKKYDPPAWAVLTENLVILDGDGQPGRETFNKLGINPHVKTPSNGLHGYFEHPGWHVPTLNSKSKKELGQRWPGLDIRANGGYALFCGRNTKGEYRWIRPPKLDSLDTLPTDLREFLGLIHPPVEQVKTEKKPKAQKVQPEYVPSDDPTPIANILLERHLAGIDIMGGRDIACFLLACQLRDNNYSQSEAYAICIQFASRAPLTDQHGRLDPFTEASARAKVDSAYSYPKRDPWSQSNPSERKEMIIIRHIVPQVSREEHERLLREAGIAIRIAIIEHITRDDGSILIIVVPPGVGKSHVASLIARDEFIVAWIAQNHDMVNSIGALIDEKVRIIQPISEDTCSHYKEHIISGKRRINSMSVHSKHPEMCYHIEQHEWTATAVYMTPHIKTAYPASKQAIFVDEVNMSHWLPELEITVGTLQDILYGIKSTECFEDLFIRAWRDIITDCAQSKTAIDGIAIFDRLNKNDQLVNWLGALGKKYAAPLLYLEIDNINDPMLERTLDNHAPHYLPAIVKALLCELVQWQTGTLANSRIRIGPSAKGYSLFITEPMEFVPLDDGTLPPIVMLDGTADEQLYATMLDKSVTTLRVDVPCAPNTELFAVHTGKWYGSTSLTRYNTEDLDRACREVRSVLSIKDPNGKMLQNRKVGLITFKDCRENMANALGIPPHLTLHFFDLRGKNDLEDCSILLVVGTPTLNPQVLIHMARSLYHDDPNPINEDWTHEQGYVDSRLKQLNTFITNSELTQAAHRIRPIRHENKTIITFGMGEVDFLPITEELIQFPWELNKEGQDASLVRDDVRIERMKNAYDELSKNGLKVTVETLKNKAGVRKQTAAQWLRENGLKNGSANPICESHMGTRNRPANFERKSMFDDTDLPHYKGIEKGARVDTALGQGVVNRIVPILGVRIVVYLDKADTRGITMHTFDWNEVHPIVVETPVKTNAGFDELFAGIS